MRTKKVSCVILVTGLAVCIATWPAKVWADGPTPEIIVIREKTPRVSPSEAPIQVNVPAVAQAINGLPPILGRDVLAQPGVLPRLNADAPAYPLLLSARNDMPRSMPKGLAADARDVLQSTWVPSPDSMPNSMLYLYNWPAPPMVTALAKYQVGGVVVFIAASNWGTGASVATSPGARTHSLATHQALAEQTLELCRRFLAPAHVPPAANAIVEHTKFSLLPDGRTGVLRGHFGNLTIWSDGDTLATYLVRTDRAITTLSPGDAQAPTPTVTVNGRGLIPGGGQTATEHGITSVALRPFCEGVGASVYWIPASRAAIVARQGKAAWFQEGNQTAVLDGVETPLPVAPYIHEGKMMVPLDPLVAWLGGTLARDEQAQTIQVSIPALLGATEAPKANPG